ncbi:MAG: hypothetical protein JNK77_10085 [Saprospiraceae bacterium]|nr:hypothetical protein [Saprospiraceae bacterium]
MIKGLLPNDFFAKKEEWLDLLRANANEKAERFYFVEIIPKIIPIIKHKVGTTPQYDGIISLLGFTPETVVLAYKLLTPQKLVILHTPETEKNLDTVLKYSGIEAKNFFHESFLHDEEHIDDIYLALQKAMSRFKKGSKVVIEMTGGKKTMGTQLAIAAGVLEQKLEVNIDVCYIDYDKYIQEFRKPEPETIRLLLIKNPLAAPYKIFGNIDESKLDNRELVVNPVFKERNFTTNADLTFILMPFTLQWSNRLWSKLIKPVCNRVGLNAVRADDLSGKEIMEDIWKGIFEAKIIIADITGRNANVFYELGITHTLGKEFILLSQSIEDIPFDLNKFRFILYEDNIDGFEKLERDLEKVLRELT